MIQLIRWPASLTHFECGGVPRNALSFAHQCFETWLSSHRDTLKHIRIGSVSEDNTSHIFNPTLFPNLESLSLSQWDIKQAGASAADPASLLGPKLKTFGWYFDDVEYDTKGWCGFGETEALWLRTFVKVAIERKAALRTVKIRCTLYGWNSTVYPWDRMDEIRDKLMRPNGLDLFYNEPSMTRKAWLRKGIPQESDTSQLEITSASINTQLHIMEDEEEHFDVDEYMDGLQPQTGYHGEDIREHFACS